MAALQPLLPVFLSYVLSFVFVGIYWNNHHHLLHAVQQVNGRRPLGEPASAVLAVALSVRYAVGWGIPALRPGRSRLMARSSCLRPGILDPHARADCSSRPGIALAVAVGRDFKGGLSIVIYAVGDPARVR